MDVNRVCEDKEREWKTIDVHVENQYGTIDAWIWFNKDLIKFKQFVKI